MSVRTNLEHKVAIGRAARELIELGAEEHGDDPHFWETIAKQAADKLGLKLFDSQMARDSMTDEEARHFERTVVPFGVYAGETVANVPHDYWLAITESKFNRQLVRYLRSERFQRIQEDS